MQGLYIYFSSAQLQPHVHRARQYKIKGNTDAFDDAVRSDMRLRRQVDSLLIMRAFISQSDLVHHVEYRDTSKLQQT